MGQLFLTSSGFFNLTIRNKFLEIIPKPTKELKIIFIPTASITNEELEYVEYAKKELMNLGILQVNIKSLDLNFPPCDKDLEGFDVIYVCGGNTFYLLKKVRESGFDKKIIEFLKKDKIYVGVSAGSILVGPSTETAIPFDVNDSNITDFTGLNLTKFIIVPHFNNDREIIVSKYKDKFTHPIVGIRDCEVVVVNGRL